MKTENTACAGRTADAEKTKRLWILTELYYPEETSTGYYLTRIAESLTGLFEVKVVCGQPNYAAKGTKAARREVRRNVEIFRVFGTTFDKNKIIFRIVNILTLSFSMFVGLLAKVGRGDRILVVTTPPSLPLIATVTALLRGAGYVLLIHDNYPELLIAAGKTSENSLFVKFADFVNRWIYKYAAKIIVVGRDMNLLVAGKTEGLDVPVVTIPNWAELENVRPARRENNRLLAELSLTDKFVFLYAGNMGHPNDLETIVECAEKLSAEKQFHFIFLGAGVKKKWLTEICRKLDLSNVTILEPRPRSEQIDFLNACDVALVSLVDKMRGVSMPSRTYNILAAGKPILAVADRESELAQVIREENVGWCVAPGDCAGMLAAVRSIYENRGDLKILGANAENAAFSKYSAEVILEKYRQTLK